MQSMSSVHFVRLTFKNFSRLKFFWNFAQVRLVPRCSSLGFDSFLDARRSGSTRSLVLGPQVRLVPRCSSRGFDSFLDAHRSGSTRSSMLIARVRLVSRCSSPGFDSFLDAHCFDCVSKPSRNFFASALSPPFAYITVTRTSASESYDWAATFKSA
jgi:hypothetical protein